MSIQIGNEEVNAEAQQGTNETMTIEHPSDIGRGNTPVAQILDDFEGDELYHNTKIDDGKSFTERLASFREGCDKLFKMGTEICDLLKEHFPGANFCLIGTYSAKLDNSVPSDLVRVSLMDAEGNATTLNGLIGLCVHRGRVMVCETTNGAPSEEQGDALSAQQVLDDFFSEENIATVYDNIINANNRRNRVVRSRFA